MWIYIGIVWNEYGLWTDTIEIIFYNIFIINNCRIGVRMIYCGKNIDFNGLVRLSSKCLSTSNLKEEPHEIKGEV